MGITQTERRQIENEMIFRRKNEKIGDDLDTLDEMHREDGHNDLIRDENLQLHFQCECSDENCTARIPMLLAAYQEIHVERDNYIVIPGHQVDLIEEVLKKTPQYNVVKKNNSTAEPGANLNTTTIDNA